MRRHDVVAFSACFVVAATLAISLSGFTVDDALISARYAHNLHRGLGYVMSAGGQATDGVTPLGFAHLLSPFADTTWSAHRVAKWLGIVVASLGAGAVGVAIGRAGTDRSRWTGLLVLFASLPFGAWAGSGMETGLVAGLVAIGVALRAIPSPTGGIAEPIGPLLLGVAAGFRPELIATAVCLGVPRALSVDTRSSEVQVVDGDAELAALGKSSPLPTRAHALRFAIVIAPFVLACVVRTIAFGRPAPLSSLAKAPDMSRGLGYAAACFAVTGAVVVIAPLVSLRAPAFVKWLAAAVFVHFAAVAGAGGDWMPLSRLIVPIVPVLALAAAHHAVRAARWATAARLVVALAGEASAWVTGAEKAVRVERERAAIADRARPVLENAHAIATLDAGWPGAVAPDAEIVDLAGVTDPTIATMPGGHTSHRIPESLLTARKVDRLVLLADGPIQEPWPLTRFSRYTEKAIAVDLTPEQWEIVFVSEERPTYVVLARREP